MNWFLLKRVYCPLLIRTYVSMKRKFQGARTSEKTCSFMIYGTFEQGYEHGDGFNTTGILSGAIMKAAQRRMVTINNTPGTNYYVQFFIASNISFLLLMSTYCQLWHWMVLIHCIIFFFNRQLHFWPPVHQIFENSWLATLEPQIGNS